MHSYGVHSRFNAEAVSFHDADQFLKHSSERLCSQVLANMPQFYGITQNLCAKTWNNKPTLFSCRDR